MNTQQLLEESAKAYGLEGYTYVNHAFYEGMERRNFEDNGFEVQTQTWNPLVDKADLYNLMKKLKIRVNFDCCYATNNSKVVYWPKDALNDAYAIVMLATGKGVDCNVRWNNILNYGGLPEIPK